MKNNSKRWMVVMCVMLTLGMCVSEMLGQVEVGFMDSMWSFIGWTAEDKNKSMLDAVKGRNLEIIMQIDKSSEEAKNAIDENGDSVLMVALDKGYWDIGEYLINADADVKYSNSKRKGFTALHVLCEKKYTSEASFDPALKIMQLLVDGGALLNDGNPSPVVLLLDSSSDYRVIDAFVKRFGSLLDVNKSMQKYHSALSYLIMNGRTHDITAVLDSKYKLTIDHATLNDALQVLCSTGWTKRSLADSNKIMKMLVTRGALVHEKNRIEGRYVVSILRTCVAADNLDALRELIALKADVNPKDGKESLLHAAKNRLILGTDVPKEKMLETYQRREAMVQALMAAGAKENCEC